jgi:hypothetical protein
MVYPGHAHELWLGKEAWQRLSDPSGMFGPWIERDPYKTLYGHFHQVARRAALIVVIGYSFHDERITRKSSVQAVMRKSSSSIPVVPESAATGRSDRNLPLAGWNSLTETLAGHGFYGSEQNSDRP